jgi:hypothetical protein
MYIEFDLDMEYDYDNTGWKCIGALSCEGNTLEQLIDDAVVFLYDQDGGECGEIPIGDLPIKDYLFLSRLITEKFLDEIEDYDSSILEQGQTNFFWGKR